MSANIPSRRSRADRSLRLAFAIAALVAASVFVWVLLFLFGEAWQALMDPGIGSFFHGKGWFPKSGSFGLLPMLFATLATTLGALVLALPLGLGAAIFSRYYAPRGVATLFRRLLELLAGIPSVVFGLWGLMVLVPAIAQFFGGPGQSLLAAIVVLGLMILPTIALTAESALRAVPQASLLSASALGLSRGAVIRRVALPTAANGIRTGVYLALARGVGETMAVLMVAGNRIQMPHDLLQPVRTLSVNIALELGDANAGHRSALFVGGLLLTLFVVLMVLWAHLPYRWWRRRVGGSGA